MADLIKVNTNRLGADQRQIGEHIRKIRELVGDLQDHNRILDGMWDGPASEAFKTSFAADIKALEEVIRMLDGINRYEENAKNKYDQCEQKVGDLVNQIHVR